MTVINPFVLVFDETRKRLRDKYEVVAPDRYIPIAPVYDTNWYAQTFTAATSYTAYSIELNLTKLVTDESFNNNLNNHFHVDVMAVDTNGLPTTEMLAYGLKTIASIHPQWASMGSNPALHWVSFILNTSVSLIEGESYAIVCHCDSGNPYNYIGWRYTV